jgi:hypothetical protein
MFRQHTFSITSEGAAVIMHRYVVENGANPEAVVANDGLVGKRI